MNFQRLLPIFPCLAAVAWLSAPLGATTLALENDQYGGVFADGKLNNKAADQLYYVGYTIPTGSTMRAPERRNFFIFDMSKLPSGLGTIGSADITLKLTVAGSIFYGDDDGSGMPGPKDKTEEFILSFDPSVTAGFILGLDTDAATNPGGALGADMDKMAAGSVFPAFGDPGMSVADPYMFMDDAPPGTPGTGTFNPVTEPGEVVMPFNSMGLAVLNSAYASGSKVIFTGRMASWSESLVPDGSGGFAESHEGIFYHTLEGVDPVDKPFLDLTFVPEPSAAGLLGVGVLCLLGRRHGLR